MAHARLAPPAPAVPPSELDYLEDVAVLPLPPPASAGERAAALVRARSGSLHGSAGAPACLPPARSRTRRPAPARGPRCWRVSGGACARAVTRGRFCRGAMHRRPDQAIWHANMSRKHEPQATAGNGVQTVLKCAAVSLLPGARYAPCSPLTWGNVCFKNPDVALCRAGADRVPRRVAGRGPAALHQPRQRPDRAGAGAGGRPEQRARARPGGRRGGRHALPVHRHEISLPCSGRGRSADEHALSVFTTSCSSGSQDKLHWFPSGPAASSAWVSGTRGAARCRLAPCAVQRRWLRPGAAAQGRACTRWRCATRSATCGAFTSACATTRPPQAMRARRSGRAALVIRRAGSTLLLRTCCRIATAAAARLGGRPPSRPY